MVAAAELAIAAGYQVIGLAALIDLRLSGEFRWRDLILRAAVRYE